MKGRALLDLSVLFLALLAAAATSAHAQTLSQVRQLPPAGATDRPRERLAYFIERRAFPFDKIPTGALLQARLQAMRGGGFSGGRLSAMGPWTLAGPAPINTSPANAGRINAIAVDRSNSNTIYLGAAMGGVWKTTNGGASWTPLTDTQCSLAMGAITIDPVNPSIVYAGTGEENFAGDSYYGCGILRSTDGGATWMTLGQSVFQSAAGGATISKIVIDSATAGTTDATLYAATSIGIYKSSSGGTAWTRVFTAGYGFVTDLVAPPVAGSPLFAAVASPFTNSANGIYTSTDAGVTWSRVGGGLVATNVGRISLSVSPINPLLMYAAIEDVRTGNLGGLYRTADGGTTWTSMGATGVNCGTQCWYAMTVAASPNNENVVYFGGVGLYQSNDQGATFAAIGTNVHVDQHAFTFDPSNPSLVYSGNDGGIYRSSDAGVTWMSLNTNLAITQFYPGMSLHPTATFPMLGGTQDNGTLEYLGALPWSPAIGGDGGYTAINPLVPTTSFGETQWSPNSGFSGPRRRTAGTGFNLVVNGIGTGDNAQFIPPLVMDPAHPNILFFGTSRIYRTANSGDQWKEIRAQSNDATVTALGVATSDTLVLYAGTTAGEVQVTSTGGVGWTFSITGLPTRVITDFAVLGGRSDIAYLTVSGFGTGHVFKTVNRGVSWTNVSGNLPNVPANAIVTVPGGELFVGTDLGVYRSGDDGATWSVASSGLPNVAVFDLAYSIATQTLVAATHGRSVWTASVPASFVATQLTVEGGTSSITTSTVIAPQFTVSVREVTGVTVPGASNLVTAQITAGGGTLNGTTSVAAVNGVATFANLSITGAGVQTLTFTTPGLSAATTSITVTVPTSIAVAPLNHRDTASLGALTGHSDSADVTLAGTLGANTAWTAATLRPWVVLTTSSGFGSGRVRWKHATGLTFGVYVDTITVTATGAIGSPQRIIDTLVVRAPTAAASFTPDTIHGALNDVAAIDLTVDLDGLAGVSLGAYTANITWDSTGVRLDSVRAVPGGFATPAVTAVSAGATQLSAADAAGRPGVVGVARLFFHFARTGAITFVRIDPVFSTLTSTTGTDLTPGMLVRRAIAIQQGVLRGDVNGDGQVTAADALLILQAVVGIPVAPPAKLLQNGDTNCNGKLEAADAQIVLALLAGFPVTRFCVNTIR